MVSEVNAKEKDVLVRILYPHGTSESFFWPDREASCFITIPHIITIVDPPKSIIGRIYNFTQECMTYVNNKVLKNIKEHCHRI